MIRSLSFESINLYLHKFSFLMLSFLYLYKFISRWPLIQKVIYFQGPKGPQNLNRL